MKKILLLFILFSVTAEAVIPHRPGSKKFIWGNGGTNVDIEYEVSGTNGSLIYDGTDFTFGQALDITGTLTLSGELTTSGDNLTLGDGTNTNKKQIFDKGSGGNNPFIGYDSGLGTIVFSNDGTIVSQIVVKSEGVTGQNFFGDKNPEAEKGTNNWTNTGGGTFATNSTTPINGANDFRWNASAQNDVIRSDQVVIPEKFKGNPCQIEFSYTGGTNDLVKPQVVDSSNVKLTGATYINLVDGSDFLQAQAGIVTRVISFDCPASGTVAFEFNQTVAGDPANMDFDDVHIGQPVSINEVKNSHENGVRVETCNVTNSGTPITANALCDGWISSLGDNSLGSVRVNFIAGIFRDNPVCTCMGTDLRLCFKNATETTSFVDIITRENTFTQIDAEFSIICVGKR
ncbi:MAG: hypothetical protein V3R67_03445 [Thermodesulfobacteriota bacterium]